MDIRELRLPVRDFTAQRAFYAETLGLPLIDESARAFTVRAGESWLTFEATGTPVPPNHYAFNVPSMGFEEAKAWLRARVPLLTDADGREAFHSESWNADMCYFADPDGNIGEIIARHRLPEAHDGGFDANAIRCISEIGLAVDDVAGTVAALGAKLGITPYLGRASDDFTAVGDERGLLIVVRRRRAWFPTDDRRADTSPIALTLAGVQALPGGVFRLDGYEYPIKIAHDGLNPMAKQS